MSHFAKIENGIVTNVIVAEQDFINTGVLGDPELWVQTSYNTSGGVHYGPDRKPDGGIPIRKNYAGIGDIYDKERDAFYVIQPFKSWILNEDTCYWEPPVPCPNDGKFYDWSEGAQQWVEFIPSVSNSV